MPDINSANNELKNMLKNIERIKDDINIIIEKLKNYMINLDIYYKISEEIIKNYKSKKKNYPVIQNINDIIDFMKNNNNIISKINIKKFLIV